MTPLRKPIYRVTAGCLDGSFGCDRGRQLIACLAPGDLIALKPKGLSGKRVEIISLFDIYRYAIRCRVGRQQLEKARERKAKAEQLKRERAVTRAAKRDLARERSP